MQQFCGQVAAATYAAIGLLHVWWAMGSKAGRSAAIPVRDGRPAFTPTAAQTWAVAGALFTAAALVFGTARDFDRRQPQPLLRWGSRAVALVMLLRAVGDFRLLGFTKSVKGTAFARADTRYYSPLCLALAILSALAARSKTPPPRA